KRDKGEVPASFLGASIAPFVSQKMLQRGQQKSTELAPGAIHGPQVIPSQQPREKLLGQFLGIIRTVTAAAHMGIERIPVSAAQLLKRRSGLRPTRVR